MPLSLQGAAKQMVSHPTDRLASKYYERAVFLAGGGEDSAATLALYLQQAAEHGNRSSILQLHTIYFNYGQLTAEPELYCIRRQLLLMQQKYGDLLECQPVISLGDPLMPFLRQEKHYMTTGQGHDAGMAHAIEYRNMRYLTMAAAYAAHVRANVIVAGISTSAMIDGGYAATLATQYALLQNVNNPQLAVRLFVPYIMANRSAVALALAEQGEDFAGSTFSCYNPVCQTEAGITYYSACGECPSCAARQLGHRLAGTEDVGLVGIPVLRSEAPADGHDRLPVAFQWKTIDGWVECNTGGGMAARRRYAKQMAEQIGLGYRELYAD